MHPKIWWARPNPLDWRLCITCIQRKPPPPQKNRLFSCKVHIGVSRPIKRETDERTTYRKSDKSETVSKERHGYCQFELTFVHPITKLTLILTISDPHDPYSDHNRPSRPSFDALCRSFDASLFRSVALLNRSPHRVISQTALSSLNSAAYRPTQSIYIVPPIKPVVYICLKYSLFNTHARHAWQDKIHCRKWTQTCLLLRWFTLTY